MIFRIHVPKPGFPLRKKVHNAMLGTRIDYVQPDGVVMPCRVSNVEMFDSYVELTLHAIPSTN